MSILSEAGLRCSVNRESSTGKSKYNRGSIQVFRPLRQLRPEPDQGQPRIELSPPRRDNGRLVARVERGYKRWMSTLPNS